MLTGLSEQLSSAGPRSGCAPGESGMARTHAMEDGGTGALWPLLPRLEGRLANPFLGPQISRRKARRSLARRWL